jgi:hypothetical protein
LGQTWVPDDVRGGPVALPVFRTLWTVHIEIGAWEMQMSRLAVLPLLATVAIGLAACGSSSGGAPGAPGGAAPGGGGGSGMIPGCSVLSLDRAKQLIGDDAAKEDDKSGKCSYRAASTGANLTVDSVPDADGKQWDLTRKVGGAADKVDGVGDEALFRSFVSTLYVRKGKTNYSFQVVQGMTDASVDTAKTLANEILAKL